MNLGRGSHVGFPAPSARYCKTIPCVLTIPGALLYQRLVLESQDRTVSPARTYDVWPSGALSSWLVFRCSLFRGRKPTLVRSQLAPR